MMLVFNTVIMMMVGVMALYDFNKYNWVDDSDKALISNRVLYFSLILLNTMILACSAVRIRSLLRSLHNAFPNEKFIGIHVLNSVLYTFLFFVLTIIMILQNRMSESLKTHYDKETAL